MKHILTLCIWVIALSLSAQEAEIRKTLDDQVACWNQGDLECFMEGYWSSDSLVFVGSQGLTYGYDQVLDNYRRSYPDVRAMGKLTFKLKKLTPLGMKHYLVIGQWTLKRENDQPSGHFSLLFEKQGKVWRIIADHSS